ncbi:MAG: MauE/DoxX family redox-associated membrane protein [Parvibaculum sedimenti]|uniref:MauE/DoxX family redox-associated membrane protein n=1 Tax=Parvibaculum sedimenti TaxID=2608632 RepID=UPI003BB65594
MIDPVIDLALRGSLAAILGYAAFHKLRDRATFEGQLAAYALLPEGLVHPTSRALPLIEGAAALFLLARSEHASLLSAALFLLYAGAMGINLARGRNDIDCGCGGPEGRQTLHWALVFRNLLLALGAFATGLPLAERPLFWPDDAIAGLSAVALIALYAALNALIANMPATKRLKA